MASLARDPIVRLVLLVATLGLLLAAFWLLDPISESDLRDAIDPLGPLGPIAFVVVAGVLGALLVPGPLLAGASGLLFGTALGTGVTICSAVVSSVIALRAGARFGSAGVEQVSGRRATVVAERLRDHGLAAVIVQRLMPGVPDAPASYAAGTIRIRTWQIVLGTMIGAAPRAFSYTAIGDSLGSPGSALGWIGLAGILLTGAVGLALAWRFGLDLRSGSLKERRLR